MSGRDFAFLDGEPTAFIQADRRERREVGAEETYRGPALSLGVAMGELMWSLDRVRRVVEARIDGWRTEEPELRRVDGVLIWLVSSVLTAISLLGGLHLLG